MNSDYLQDMINIIGDTLDRQLAIQCIEWGKGNLQVALNYYYNKNEKKQIPKILNQLNQTQSGFSKIKEGQKKYNQLEKLQTQMRQVRKKPVQSVINCLQEKQQQNDELFNCVDYLPDIFSDQFKTFQQESDMSEQNQNVVSSDEVIQLQIQESQNYQNQIINSQSQCQNLSQSTQSDKKMIKESVNEYYISQNNLKRSLIQFQNSEEDMEIEEKYPKLIGESLINCSSTKKMKNDIKKGDKVYLQLQKSKIVGDQKKIKNDKNAFQIIRLIWKNNEIARVDQIYADIYYKLLDRNLISVEGEIEYSPTVLDIFTTIKVRIFSYLLQKAVTIPIISIINEGENTEEEKILSRCKETREDFIQLFNICKVKIIQNTLVQIPQKNLAQVSIQKVQPLQIQDSPITKQRVNIFDPFQKPIQQQSILKFMDKSKNDQIKNENVGVNQKEEINKEIISDKQLQNIFLDYGFIKQDIQYVIPLESFKSDLHPYQKQALTWMLYREGKLDLFKLQRDKRILHPQWQSCELHDNQKIYFNPYTGQISTEFPRSRSEECLGGILADEMGLGKTVMMIALIHCNKKWDSKVEYRIDGDYKKQEFESDDNDNDEQIESPENILYQQNIDEKKQGKQRKYKGFTTDEFMIQGRNLVVVPLTLLSQWGSEIEEHSRHKSINYLKYYQLSKNEKENLDLSLYDVVITTYGTLSSEWTQNAKKKQPLFRYEWYRIIIDEAHYIKGRTINIAKACFELKGLNRWCLTGTPIQNRLNELFSLIHFIRLQPWDDFSWWNKYILQVQKDDPKLVNNIIQTIIKPILLRRCKDSKDQNGLPIIVLPDKHYSLEWTAFTPQEQILYNAMQKKDVQEIRNLENQGIMTSKYFHVFQLINKLRQLCDHVFMLNSSSDVKQDLRPTLEKFYEKRNVQAEKQHSHFEVIMNDDEEEQLDVKIPEKPPQEYFDSVINQIEAGNYVECQVCFNLLEDSIITSCLHIFCRACIVTCIHTNPFCPNCRRFLTKEDYMTIPRQSRFSNNMSDYSRSSKINAIMKKLQPIIQANEKVVIFTIFLGMMDLLEHEFTLSGYNYLRFDGSTSQKNREKYINMFKNDDEYKIIIISLAAGGCGLNLTVANHVFIVDPWWNPAVEDQAIERVHRIGQKKDVFVTRFLMLNSIEERMHEICLQKKDLFDNIMKGKNLPEVEQKGKQLEMFKQLLNIYQ